jgi:predicted nuclease of predicted toxin-antitoxin system
MSPRFLIDGQLPPALAAALRNIGCDAAHVADLGLLSSDDTDVWREPVGRGAALVTRAVHRLIESRGIPLGGGL